MPVAQAMDTLTSNMIAASTRQDIAANNLANINTTGFKKDQVSFATEFDSAKVAQAVAGRSTKTSLHEDVFYGHIPVDMPVMIEAQYTSQEQGSSIFTENPLDVAIQGKGYFVLQTPEGERYTRAGSFRLSENSFLVDQNGYPVFGQSGPISISGQDINITDAGDVQIDGAIQDKLRIVDVNVSSDLMKDKDGFYKLRDEGDAVTTVTYPTVQSRQLESSNVRSIEELNAMTINMRAFEASSKAIKTVERTVSRAINGIGKV
jgi:flagellar basal-body rod protein FlgG